MRTPIVILAGSLLLACSSGTHVVYVPVPEQAPAPAPQPVQIEMPPVGVNIVRIDQGRLLLSTNQSAYVAVFDIEQNRGVTLVYPTTSRQPQVALTGSTWLEVTWRPDRSVDDRDPRGYGRRPTVHHIYAIASDRPLHLMDAAFDDDGMRSMLGSRAYFATEPYATMGALARRFVQPGADEDWGEDLYTIDVLRRSMPARVAKIYCRDGSVVYVRDDMADRAACPSHGRGVGSSNTNTSRPDSVVTSNGRRVATRPNGPAHVFRIPTSISQSAPQSGGETAADRPPRGNGRGNGTPNDVHGDRPTDVGVQQQGKSGQPKERAPEAKDPKDAKEVKDAREPKDEKQAKDVKEPKEEKQAKDAKESKEKKNDKPATQPKSDAKGMRGVMDRIREKAHADSVADSTSKNKKP